MPIYRSLATLPVPAAGQYLFPVSPFASGTSAALNNGNLKLAPWLLPRTLKLDRMGSDVATIGDAGSLFRIGLYADNGNAYPGALILDAGTILGDSATVQDITVALTLAPGLYWIGGAVQAVTVTQPTMRTASNWTPPVPMGTGTSLPTAGQNAAGYNQTAVTGALPANFTATPVSSGNVARVHVRAA